MGLSIAQSKGNCPFKDSYFGMRKKGQITSWLSFIVFQLCLSASASVTLTAQQNVLYIDTTGAYSSHRLQDIMISRESSEKVIIIVVIIVASYIDDVIYVYIQTVLCWQNTVYVMFRRAKKRVGHGKSAYTF